MDVNKNKFLFWLWANNIWFVAVAMRKHFSTMKKKFGREKKKMWVAWLLMHVLQVANHFGRAHNDSTQLKTTNAYRKRRLLQQEHIHINSLMAMFNESIRFLFTKSVSIKRIEFHQMQWIIKFCYVFFFLYFHCDFVYLNKSKISRCLENTFLKVTTFFFSFYLPN